MRTCLGMKLRISDMSSPDMTSTNMTETPMAKQLMTLLVTARVGQVPSTMTNTGFSFQNPRSSTSIEGEVSC